MRKILIYAFVMLCAVHMVAQERTVTGEVVDASDGSVLPGVNVIIQGTTQGVTADFDGNYSIKVPNDTAVLEFSYLGYTKEIIEVGNRATIDVSMNQDATELSEVVVTAFGIEKQKKALGYSVEELKGDDLTIARDVNVMNSIKGKVAGVFINSSSAGVGGSSFVSIRGNSSLGGDNQPLYVVDGVPINNQNLDGAEIFGGGRDYGDGIQNINPDDIETLSVLKGPNAAALYGSRGANGVILITTKTGTKKGWGVSFNSNTTFEEPNILPTFQNEYGVGYDDDMSSWNTETINGVDYPQIPQWALDHWGPKMEGQLVTIQALPDVGVVPLNGQPENNVRKFYRTGSTLTNTMAVTSGTEQLNFRLSASNLTNEGIIPNSGFDRNTVNLNVGANITDKFRVEAKANYINQKGKNRPATGQSSTLAVAPSLNLMGRHVDLDWLKEYKTEDGEYRNWKANGPVNPYWIVNEMLTSDERNRFIGFLSANYDFTDWLSLRAKVGSDFYSDLRYERIGQGTPGSARRDGVVSKNTYNVKELNTDVILTASNDLSENFTGSLSLGANKYTYKLEKEGYTGTKLDIPDLYQITNTLNTIITPDASRKETQSLFFNGQLGYKDYLFLDVTGRNDWSSTLGIGNYSFFYPSASLSFVFSDALNTDPKFLTFGKVRASYAEAGNDASPYQTITGYANSQSSFQGQRYASLVSNVKNADLKNELTSSYEFGADIRLFNDRLGIDFTYYNSSTTNQILPAEISASSGYQTILVNAGEITNAGIELLLTATPISIPDTFSWDVSLNFSKNKSEVVSLVDGIDSYTLISAGGANIEARPGEAYGNIVGFPYKRNEAGRKIITSSGSFQRDDEQAILGNVQPDWLGGITNTFTYKGFALSSLIDIRQGGQIYSFSKYDQMAKGTGKFTENRDNLVADGVVENEDGSFSENTQVVIGQAYYAQQAWGNIGEEFVLDADYIALREASIGYDFNQKILSRTPFKTARFSIVGRNLFYLQRDDEVKSMGISPEAAFAPTAAAQGYEFSSVPSTRSIGFNLSLSL